MKSKVLIACLENWDTLQEIPFVIKQAGCTVDIYCSKKSWLLCNSFYDNWIERNDDEKIWKAEIVGLANHYDWIVLGDEKLLNEMNSYIQDDETAKKILPLKKPENRYIIASKSGLSKFCEANDILSPRFFVYTNDDDLALQIPKLSFPVLIKPDLSWGGGGIILCNDAATLQQKVAEVDYKNNMIIQEFIKGDDIGIEALYKNGELLMYNASEVLKYFDSAFSFTTRRNCYKTKPIETVLRDIGKKIGIHGFASVQLIGKNGKYYLIEVDMRPNFWVAYDRFADSDFSEAVKMLLDDNITYNNSIPSETPKKEIAIFYRDIIRCFNNKDVKAMLQWLTNYKGCWKFIPTYDKKLFKRVMYELFVKKVKKKLFGQKD